MKKIKIPGAWQWSFFKNIFGGSLFWFFFSLKMFLWFLFFIFNCGLYNAYMCMHYSISVNKSRKCRNPFTRATRFVLFCHQFKKQFQKHCFYQANVTLVLQALVDKPYLKDRHCVSWCEYYREFKFWASSCLLKKQT